MKAIEYTSKAKAQALQDRLDKAIIPIAMNGTIRYGDVMEHPTENKWAVPVTDSGYYWEAIQKELTDQEKAEIKILSDDWFVTGIEEI